MTPVKPDPQSYGICLTYMRRYALSALVGICPEDTDGNGADGKPEGEKKTVDTVKETFPGATEVDKDRISTKDGWPSLAGKPKVISEKQGKMLYAVAKKAGIGGESLKGAVTGKYNVEHIADITMGQFNDILEWVQGGCKDE